jgi:hypothetical protein
MTLDQQSGIESEIRETGALEATSAVSDLPSTVTRDVTMFDGQASHTDTGVDVVVDIDVDIDDDVLAVVDVDIDVDVDVDTHVDQ